MRLEVLKLGVPSVEQPERERTEQGQLKQGQSDREWPEQGQPDRERTEQNRSAAELRLYLLDALSVAPEKKRPMVIVVPGGGYHFRSDREKEPVVMRFLGMGYHGAVLEYSVAPARFPTALLELAQAVAAVREHADEWQVDERHIFVCGFSAGGHLACSIGTFWNRSFVYDPIGKTPEQIRPDGLILCYPVITSGEFCHAGSFENLLGPGWPGGEQPDEERTDGEQLNGERPDGEQSDGERPDGGQPDGAWPGGDLRQLVSLEKQVTEDMPPVFLWHTVTDESVPVENSLFLAAALRRHRVPFEMHLYPSGRHGLALATEETAGNRPNSVEPCCQTWISLVQSWVGDQLK